MIKKSALQYFIFFLFLGIPSSVFATELAYQANITDDLSQLINNPGESKCSPRVKASISSPRANSVIESSIEALAKAQPIQCQELAVGQSRIVNADEEKSPTSIGAAYRLTRSSANDYMVELNINFIDKSGAHNPSVSEEFRRHADFCYQRADQALVGPQGEHLHIKVIDEGDPGPLPPAHTIKQAADDFRGDEENFNLKTFSCPIFLHESLHMMGLVDEYHEGQIGIVPDGPGLSSFHYTTNTQDRSHTAFDCRASGDHDSVMTDQGLAWSKSYGPQAAFTTVESCECRTETCHFTKSIPGAQSCPAGSEGTHIAQSLSGYSPDLLIGLKPIDDKHAVITVNPSKFTGQSLLKPAHFNSIVHPGCSVNMPYYSCALNAYRSSQAHGGLGCLQAPSYCSSTSANWTKDVADAPAISSASK